MNFSSPALRGLATVAVVATVVGCGVQQTDLAVKVVDARTGDAIASAQVSVNAMDQQTARNGVAHFMLRPDTYEVSVSHPAYLPLTSNVVLYPGAPQVRTIALYPRPDGPPGPDPSPDPQPSGAPSAQPSGAPQPHPSADAGVAVFGRVTDDHGSRVAGAMVMIEASWGVPVGSANTNAQGEYRVDHMPRGQQLHVTAVADGYKDVSRVITPTSDWRVDFAGQFALKTDQAPMPDPAHPATVLVQGDLEDTFGHPLDGVIVHIEASNVRYPYDEMVIGRHGHYHALVPTDLPLRFTASKTGYRSTTFEQTVPAATFGEALPVDFTGPRALDLLPVPEPGMGIRAVPGPKFVR